MRALRTFFIFMAAAALAAGLPWAGAASEEVSDVSHDFKFLEMQRDLRENPRGPHAREEIFAIGEYYFHENIPQQAAEYFRRFDPSDLKELSDLTAAAYLTRAALLAGDTEAASALEKKLQEALSSGHFFTSFNEPRVQSWKSPLGNRFDFREFVDRLEISINGAPFYTISFA